VASINNTYELKNLIGPGSASASVTVMIRLRQETGGNVVYKTLMEPRTVTADAILPVRFKAIEGVYGVDTGQVEVVDVENDQVLMSYDVQFFKVQ
jgi:serine/threonine-protein kinase